MIDNTIDKDQEIARLKAQGAVLEQLLEVHEQTTLEQSDRLEQALHALTKRASELETVAWVSTVASTILEADKLLQEVADLTKSSFSLYHTHIYMLNEAGDTLKLAAGAGEVGRQMVAQRWSIPLAREQSLVARAARTRQGIIVNNVQEVPYWLPNPLLPDTRSELATPMMVGDRVLGVLDVQSDEMDHFTEEDVRIQTTLAAQVAVALQNARSFAEQQQAQALLNARVNELNCLNEISREIVEAPPIADLLQWVTERIPPAMQHPNLCIAAIEYEGQVYGEPKAVGLPCQIVHALRIGNEVVGRVYIAYTEKREFLDEESALIGGIAGRLSGYIESRRLIEQIQQRATELEEATNFLDSIVDNIPIGIFVKKAEDLSFVEWNSANEKLTGLKKEGVFGKNDYDLFPPDEADFFTAKDRKVLTERKSIDIPEEAIETAHAGTRFLHTRKIPIFGLDGKPKYLLGISEDITERKQAAETIIQQREFFSKIINILPLGVFAKDVQNEYCFSIWNAKMEEMFGIKAEKMLGKTDYDYSEKKVADSYRQADIAATMSRQIIDIPIEEITTVRGVRLAHTTKLPIYDREGNPETLLVVLEDITERKQGEEALSRSQEQLSEALQIAKLASWKFDLASQDFTFNDQFYAIFKTTAEQEGGYVMPAALYAQKYVHPDDVGLIVREIQMLAESNDPNYTSQLDYRIIRADDEEGYLMVHFRKDQQGQTIGAVGIIQDITERKQAELERERLLADVEAAYRQFVRREWEQFLGEQHSGGWHIEHRPAGQSGKQELETLAELKNEVSREGAIKVVTGANNGHKLDSAMVAPITLRGEVIGTLSLQDITPDRKWTDEEMTLVQTVSDQLALTVENLRLFDDTQKQATREQLTRQITDKMRSAPNIDTIIQTGLTELAKTLNLSRAYVKLTTKPEADHAQSASTVQDDREDE